MITIYGYAFSLFLIAIGAILKFAVTVTVSGVNLDTAGAVLLIIGIVGLVFTFGFHLISYEDYEDDSPRRHRRHFYRRDDY